MPLLDFYPADDVRLRRVSWLCGGRGARDGTLLCISSCSMPAIAGRLRTAGLGGGWWGSQSSIRAGALKGGGWVRREYGLLGL